MMRSSVSSESKKSRPRLLVGSAGLLGTTGIGCLKTDCLKMDCLKRGGDELGDMLEGCDALCTGRWHSCRIYEGVDQIEEKGCAGFCRVRGRVLPKVRSETEVRNRKASPLQLRVVGEGNLCQEDIVIQKFCCREKT